MEVFDMINLFNDVKTEKAFVKAVQTVQKELPWCNFSLLLPDENVSSNRRRLIGEMSKEMSTWVESYEIRSQIEQDQTLMPTYYYGDTDDKATGFILSASTPSYSAIWLCVEYNLGGCVKQDDVFMCMAACRYIAKAFRMVSKNKKKLLTPREKECMSWIASGKTSWEVSKILGLTERTINFHIQNCMVKTNSANRIEAVAKCITQSLIDLNNT